MRALGHLVARGRTSLVFEFGPDCVVKVPRPETPSHWLVEEARLISAIRRVGVNAPKVREIININGKASMVLERIKGRSVWQHIVEDPARTKDWAKLLAQVHIDLLTVPAPTEIPPFLAKTAAKIDLATRLPPADRAAAASMLATLPAGRTLLHGDFHPGNVIIGPDGPVIIDWFDASAGHADADIVRSSIMMRPSSTTHELPHLVGSTRPILTKLHRSYLGAVAGHVGSDGPPRTIWEGVLAVSRLSEGVHYDTDQLVDLWLRCSRP